MLDGRRLTGCLKLTYSFKLMSQNTAVAFDKAETETDETEECLQIKASMIHYNPGVRAFR